MTTVLEGLFQWGIQYSELLPGTLGPSFLVLCLAGLGASRFWHERNHDALSATAFLMCLSVGAAAVFVTIASWLYAVDRCNDWARSDSVFERMRFGTEGCANVPGAVPPRSGVFGSP